MAIFLPDHTKYLQALEPRDAAYLLGNLLLYVFRGCQQADIRDNLQKRRLDFDFLGWRRHLHTNGLLLRDGKLYLYALAAKQPLDTKTLGLTKADIRLLDLALTHRPLHSHLRTLVRDDGWDVLTARQFDNNVGKILCSNDLLTYTRKFIHKKMAFLMQSYGFEASDIEVRLLSHALYGLQRAYPQIENVGHGIAIAKTVVKRMGVNFIKERVSQKQNELIDNGDKTYSKTTISLASIEDGTGQFLTADGSYVHRSLLVVGINGQNSLDSIPWETLQSVRQLCNCSKLKSKQRRFLRLMLGTYEEEFSGFLGKNNDDALEDMSYPNYMKKVCTFLGVPYDAAAHFLAGLKDHLGGHASLATA